MTDRGGKMVDSCRKQEKRDQHPEKKSQGVDIELSVWYMERSSDLHLGLGDFICSNRKRSQSRKPLVSANPCRGNLESATFR